MFEKLINWSAQNYSDLPWRKNRTLYHTLVSEIMLQQTTVSTVKNHFERFIKKYPTITALAKASEDEILMDWKGLGYYRRAKNLLKSAKTIQESYQGEIPLKQQALLEITGIGPYTANAILGIGANKNYLALDANLERVLSRLYAIKEKKGPALQKKIQKLFDEGQIASEIFDVGGRLYNESLMDLGRSICMANKAYCELCPLSKKCSAYQFGHPLMYPQKVEKVKKSFELHLVRFVIRNKDKVLCYKKSNDQWLSGQYEVPTFVLSSEDSDFKQYPQINNDDLYFLPSFKSAITYYKIKNLVCEMSLSEFCHLAKQDYEFRAIKNGNLSTASIKAINL